LKCPVLLFQARDDSVIPVSETEAFAFALKSAGKDVTVELVPSGDHYSPMVTQGIPRAIAFFAAHGSRATGTSAPALGPHASAARSLPNR
jgi:dipeptidyl aminopeptidase/acylaminoacyl peptidase